MSKKVFFCLFGLLLALGSFSATQTEDSLLAKLPQLKGEARLRTLHELQEIELYQPKTKYYNDLLLEEAKNQENNKYIAIALTNRVAYYRFSELDTLLYHARIAEDFNSKYKFYKDLFLTKQMIVLHYLGRGYFSLGRGEAHEMYEEAKETGNQQAILSSLLSLGDAYRWLGENDESIRYVKEARKLYEPSENAPYKILDCYMGLISAYMAKGDMKDAFLYMDSLRTESVRVKKNYPLYNLIDYEVVDLISYAAYYISENRLAEAWKKIEEIDKIMQAEEIHYYAFLLNEMKMRYYNVRGDYEKVQYYYDICYKYSMEHHLEQYIWLFLKFKAELLYSRGMYREASQMYQKLQAHTDSVNRESHLYEINQIQMDYELDKRENEIDQQQKELKLRNSFNIILGVFVFSLLMAVRLIWKSLKSSKHKNLLLFNQIRELTQTKMELLAFKDLMREKVIPAINNGEWNDSDSQNSLYERVEMFMNREKPYINSEYGRKNLIADMNTNEVYLSKAIRSAVKRTIQEYINAQRIEYAKVLLLQNMNQTIETVAMDSGFTTIRNFYRLFKDAYGMSPSEFRNYVKDNYKN
jgi:AraC-like DNA-binding protein